MTYKFLFVSRDALITDLAWQIRKEGHEVLLSIYDKHSQEIGDGFVEKIADWRKHTDWADVIIFDDVLGYGELAHELRQQGKAVVGGTPYTDKLEDDRSFGQNELKEHGVDILPYWEFDDFDKAIEFVKQNPTEYVLKPSGEAQNIKRLLFVGQEADGSDIIHTLKSYKEVWSEELKVFQLQQRAIGVEIAVGAFFNGNEFVHPINVNFENKKLFTGNLGPGTGEMGTSMFWSERNYLFDRTLAKLEKTLAKEKFVGYIDINCIVNEKGIYPLEFTSRFGYPTISIQQESMITPTGEFFYRLARGEISRFEAYKGYQVGAYIAVPPYPFNDDKTFNSLSLNNVITFKNKDDLEGIHLQDVKKVDGKWVVTGPSGAILLVVGMGETMKAAQQQMYERINNLVIPNMYYRTDIGDRWYVESDLLHTWCYLHTTI